MDKGIAKRLKELRVKKGLTVAEMAKIIGVSRISVGNWERGDKKPRINHLKKYADFFGVSQEWIEHGCYFDYLFDVILFLCAELNETKLSQVDEQFLEVLGAELENGKTFEECMEKIKKYAYPVSGNYSIVDGLKISTEILKTKEDILSLAKELGLTVSTEVVGWNFVPSIYNEKLSDKNSLLNACINSTFLPDGVQLNFILRDEGSIQTKKTSMNYIFSSLRANGDIQKIMEQEKTPAKKIEDIKKIIKAKYNIFTDSGRILGVVKDIDDVIDHLDALDWFFPNEHNNIEKVREFEEKALKILHDIYQKYNID